jgi:hypothetical protein
MFGVVAIRSLLPVSKGIGKLRQLTECFSAFRLPNAPSNTSLGVDVLGFPPSQVEMWNARGE